MTILVTAAHGNQARILVPRLVVSGCRVRACVRSDASAQRLRAAGVNDVVVGDMSDPEVMDRAMRGVDSVYYIGPALHPMERAMGFAAVDAARAAGVGHFVFSSVLHSITTDLVQHEVKRDIEEHLLSSGLEFTILQPTNYMLAHRLRPAFEHGVFRLSWALQRYQSLVDLEDVTEVAQMVLLNAATHAGATYELASAGRYTAHDLTDIIATVIGTPVVTERIEADSFLHAVLGDPAQFPYEARAMRAITDRYSSHDFVGNPNVLTWLLGRAPVSFEQFVRRVHTAQ
ncbi:MAG: NmrA family NAD(P)-binding protein [Actinomycetota bacterium]|nr:NmrA family NAD(P)-binding protein [Actinomycetota bacterium]